MLSRRKPLYKYFIFWTIICCVSAAPSFWVGYGGGFDPYGMSLGIFLFIILYSLAHASQDYEQLMQRSGFLRKALSFAFGLRLLLSAIPIFAIIPWFRDAWFVPLYVDGVSGFGAVSLTQMILGKPEVNDFRTDFLSTFMTTIFQGIILSFIILLVALLAWAVLATHYRLRKPTIANV